MELTAAENTIFCATPYSLFSVNPADPQTERYSRITGLHETGISTLRYNASSKKLLIAYRNSNIDILYRNDVYNIPDIKRENTPGDKTIYQIDPRGDLFYLSTGLGVVVIDAIKYEVKDTWYIGNGGNPVPVYALTSDGTFFYAATAEGLKRAPVNAPDLADFARWQLLSGSNGLPAGACRNVLTVLNRVFLLKNDSLFVQNGTNWSLFYRDGWTIRSVRESEDKLLLCEQQGASSRVLLLQPDGNLFRTHSGTAVADPRQALLLNGQTWLADSLTGLCRFTSVTAVEKFVLNAPHSIALGELRVEDSRLFATAGSVRDGWIGDNNRNGFYVFSEGQWTNYNVKQFPLPDSLPDLLSIAISKRDGHYWAGSFGGGLLRIKPGPVLEVFKQQTLGAAINQPTRYQVAGLAFDAADNLWISNFGAAQPLRVRKADGNWQSFAPPFPLLQNALAQLLIDNNQYKWIVSPLGNGLICYDHGASIDNQADDRWRKYQAGAGIGNLPSNEVRCVAKDKNGFIWVGTSDGIGVIQCPEAAFSVGGCDAIWPVVPTGNFAGYLFKGQEVSSIAVDGADRKWVATRNGVFLVSAEGERVLYRFTEENSPLLSSDVKHIAIDGKTGEVFFGTAKGICSFRSTATEGGPKNESVLVFPNPVPPGYSGSIAIRGLVNNAVVKITELDGRLVYQTRALGGQAIWDGRNYRGQKISSGAYLVLVSDEGNNSPDGKRERTAAKLFFISN